MNLKSYIETNDIRQTALARSIGVQSQLVYYWVNGIRPVPIERCVAIERATGGVVTRRDLRPDDWWKIWPELANGDSDHQAQPCVEAACAGANESQE